MIMVQISLCLNFAHQKGLFVKPYVLKHLNKMEFLKESINISWMSHMLYFCILIYLLLFGPLLLHMQHFSLIVYQPLYWIIYHHTKNFITNYLILSVQRNSILVLTLVSFLVLNPILRVMSLSIWQLESLSLIGT